ncbi:MAG TPA: sugar phosphate nucleotidyltransferase [Candidatus Saccharimonadales bacterium]|nr:sugar phosphate nucleotidyltransferase [Candidatus Saccharimonadales bacterium]
MITVIIAGGSGTRLWPLSTPDFPKHLLTIDGETKSLLQHTYERAKLLGDDVYVISEAGHIHHVKDQLSELSEDKFIAEPARRGTASCIIAALVRISGKHDAQEPIAFMAADHYVRDKAGFVQSFKVAGNTAVEHAQMVLVGVEPDYPATGFGYIQKDNVLDEKAVVYHVRDFKEKPDYNLAQEYVRSGDYLWNCSYFIATLDTFKRMMQQHSPEWFENYQKLEAAPADKFDETYLGFENLSIDYALIEKSPDLLVTPASFDWLDLGSFGDMYKVVNRDEAGNHTLGKVETEGVENSFVQNHEDKPVAVIGLDNVVVVNTPAGIVVARKDLSQKVGEVSKRFNK